MAFAYPARKGGDLYSEDPNVLAPGATYEYFNFIEPFDGELTAKSWWCTPMRMGPEKRAPDEVSLTACIALRRDEVGSLVDSYHRVSDQSGDVLKVA